MRMTDEMIRALKLDDSFVPPMPGRLPPDAPAYRRLAALRGNVLAAFTDRDYGSRQIRGRLFATEFFVCNNPDGVRETLTAQHEAFQRKTAQQRHALEPLLGDGLFVSDRETWRERRSIVSPIVHGRHIAAFAPIMRDTVLEWCAHWHAAGDNATIDILTEMGELTAEIISRTIFGKKLGRAFTNAIVSSFAEYQRHIDPVNLPSLFGVSDRVPRPLGRRARRARDRLHAVLDEVIDALEAGAGDGEASPMIRQLFEARGRDGQPLSREAIRNEAIVIFMAGHETTANTLAWALYLVSKSRRVQGRLLAEFEAVLGGRVPDLGDVPKLGYTRAVVEETLRLYPPVPLLGREALAEGTLNGMIVPKGSTLLVAPWLLHRNRDVWSLPDHFVPERFEKAHAPVTDKYSYIPFASGPRVCPGLTFAMTESVLCLATLLQSFELRIADGHEVAVDCRLTLRPGQTLPMRVRWRPAPAPPRRPLMPADIPWAETKAPERPAPPLRHVARRGEAGRLARRHHVSERALGAAQVGSHHAFRALPPAWSSGFAARAIAPAVEARYRRGPMPARMERTVARLRPDLGPEACAEVVSRWFRNTARAMAEYGQLARLARSPNLVREGEAHLAEAKASGRPIIMLFAHTAAWEIFAHTANEAFGDRWLGPYQPQPSRYENRIVNATRARIGARLLPPGPTLARTLLRILETPGNVVPLAVDEVSEKAIKFPQFGRPFPNRCNVSFAVRSAESRGAVILPTTLLREGGTRMRLAYHPVMDAAALGAEATGAALDALYDPVIRANLDQWYMLHRLRLGD